VDLYRKGLVYRGKRMVNWCPVSLTALSDEEVVMKEQNGLLYHFKVEVAEEPGTFLTIATTRPETIPADTAIAVNPRDPRYAHLIGKHAIRALPIEQPREQRLLPIVGDEAVDFEFGTGVLKVTPAHDRTDFEIGLRHKLPVIDILNPNATMNELAGQDLAGLDRVAARKKAAEVLEAHGALAKTEPYMNKVGFSERADVPIEPRLSEQWFLKYPSVPASRTCVQPPADPTGADAPSEDAVHMRFFPDRWAKVYDHWMGGIQDWCISRQLWWGHRIPVWYSGSDPKEVRVQTDCPGEGWVQDPDVLDTWFSSWLWPFATMGWTGDRAKDTTNPTLAAFYPTTDLVTGPDIIFFWVARMIMAGYEYMGQMPFRNVYFTGIIRDKQGRKMSKSLGNSPDPLDLIAKFGADALRFGTMRSAPLGQDILFDEQNVELGRNFCNKLWNACRFRQMQGGATEGEIDPELLTSDDRWILMRLDQAIREVTQAFAEYRFSDATNTLYRFFWNEYCDWYVESSKAALLRPASAEDHPAPPPDPQADRLRANKLAVIDFVLGHTLRLFHPFLPFITEELWHGMGFAHDMPENQGGRTLMSAPWPKPLGDEEMEYFGLDAKADREAEAKHEMVTLGRNLKRAFNIAANKKVNFVLKPAAALPPADAEVLKLLLNAEALSVDDAYVAPKGTPSARGELGEIFLPLEGLIDVAAEKARLTKELERAQAEVTKVQDKLNNPNFTQKVPASVLEEHQRRLAEWQGKAQLAQQALERLV
jgi:valyl-tRNA synthetase